MRRQLGPRQQRVDRFIERDRRRARDEVVEVLREGVRGIDLVVAEDRQVIPKPPSRERLEGTPRA